MQASILVIDDDPAIRSGVAILLEQAGFRTSTAASAEQALDLLAQPPAPDLVILDIRLPALDGFALCRRTRTSSSYIPILMLSAYDDLADKVAGLELGADDYVTKPFQPRELVARVRAVLRLAAQRSLGQAGAGQPLVCGPLTLSLAEHWAAIDGHMFDLTPKEWALHVQRLRAKLEADPAVPRCIETVRGFGYRFVAASGTEGGK